ncbi:choline/ethanolamine kinase family protein [Pseudidiomarina sp.]|uniref:choline/ethanolamine kinase family protein n=1 Tax=Pseudidiomarina sp. TaxID=2081707 RepID=UPI00299E9DE0|nr:choline/ethanolamine kinase family protein [Pseudidiomarina sp.]MDX1705384.1 choline/ethanolamine kinase family protein [Pseudidiomarina sp.]
MQQQWLSELPVHGVISTEPLLRGVANDVYKITTTGHSYVLKHFRFDHPYGLDRAQEVAVQQQLAAEQLAPEVLYFDPVQGLMLQPFLDGPDLAHSPEPISDKIHVLADVSARIHRAQVEVPPWSLHSRLQRYCDHLRNFEPERGRQFTKRLQGYHKLIDSFGAHPVFCHNDLAFHHVFKNGAPLVIDWEYSGLGERYFDLASAIQVNQFDETQQRAFINAYEGIAGFQVNSNLIADWLELVKVVSQLWYELHHHLQQKHI